MNVIVEPPAAPRTDMHVYVEIPKRAMNPERDKVGKTTYTYLTRTEAVSLYNQLDRFLHPVLSDPDELNSLDWAGRLDALDEITDNLTRQYDNLAALVDDIRLRLRQAAVALED